MTHFECSQKMKEEHPNHQECNAGHLILHDSGLACVNCGWTKDMEVKR